MAHSKPNDEDLEDRDRDEEQLEEEEDESEADDHKNYEPKSIVGRKSGPKSPNRLG